NVRYNTITGQGDCLVVSHLGSSNSRIHLANNALLGGIDWPAQHWPLPQTKSTCLYYWVPSGQDEPDHGAPRVSYVDNLIWQVRNGTCPEGNRCGEDAATARCLLGALATASSSTAIDAAAERCHLAP
ncbi:hypothetical protein, partial [Dokdonella sp.]|uniref:hypothetical protein n=1 Tax=Dokdonella sp. TaxID=2291710 RepID=UPI0031C65391|nr:hypothetical protein [Dokdonella sp.]